MVAINKNLSVKKYAQTSSYPVSYTHLDVYKRQRLLWENIALRDGCIILNSKHTKTGGARHVTILPVLAKMCIRDSLNTAKLAFSPDSGRPYRASWISLSFALKRL